MQPETFCSIFGLHNDARKLLAKHICELTLQRDNFVLFVSKYDLYFYLISGITNSSMLQFNRLCLFVTKIFIVVLFHITSLRELRCLKVSVLSSMKARVDFLSTHLPSRPLSSTLAG